MSADGGGEDGELGGNVEVDEGVVKQHPAAPLEDLHIRIGDHHPSHGIIIPKRSQDQIISRVKKSKNQK